MAVLGEVFWHSRAIGKEAGDMVKVVGKDGWIEMRLVISLHQEYDLVDLVDRG